LQPEAGKQKTKLRERKKKPVNGSPLTSERQPHSNFCITS